MAVRITPGGLQSYDPLGQFKPKPGSGGGGGRSTSTPAEQEAARINAQREAEMRAAEEKARKEELAKQELLRKANIKYQQGLRQVNGVQGRQELKQSIREPVKSNVIQKSISDNKRVYYATEKYNIVNGKKVLVKDQWKPKDYDSNKDVVVYIDKGARTTGKSTGEIVIPKGIKISATTTEGERAGTAIAKQIKGFMKDVKEEPITKEGSKEDKNKSKYLIQKAKEERIPFIDSSIYELTGKTVKTKTITDIYGNQVIVPKDYKGRDYSKSEFEIPKSSYFRSDISKPDIQELPKKQKTETSIEPVTFGSNIKFKVGQIKTFIRGKYGEIFEETPSSEKLTGRKVAAEVSKGFLITAPRTLGELPGNLYGEIAPNAGITIKTKEVSIPQRVTTGGEFKFKPSEYKIVTPSEIKTIGGFIGGTAPYVLAPSVVLASGGASILTAPRSTGITTGERIEGGVMLGFGGVGLVSKGVKYFLKPTIKRVPGEAKINYISAEQPYTIRGESLGKAKFLVVRETPMSLESTSRARQLFKLKPKVKELPSRIDYAYTPASIGVKDQSTFGYFITGKKVKTPKSFKVFKFIGQSGETSDLSQVYSTLSKSEKFRLQSIAEKKVGRAVPEEFVPQILGSDYQYVSGGMTSKNLFRLTSAREGGQDILKVRIPKTGKTITSSEVSSIFKEVKTPEGFPMKVYKGKSVSKDISKPFSRLSGKPQIMKGTSFVSEPIDLTPSGSSILPKKISLATKQVQKPSVTLQKAQQQAAKALPVIRPKTVKPTLNILDTSELAPTYVGGMGKEVSVYAPTRVFSSSGNYNFKYIPASTVPGNEIKLSPAITPVGNKDIVIVGPNVKPKVDTGIKVSVKTKSKFGSGVSVTPKLSLTPKEETIVKTKQASESATKLKESLLSRYALKQSQLLKQAQLQRERFDFKSKNIPKVNLPLVPLSKKSSLTSKSLGFGFGKSKSAYEVQVRRSGKFSPVSGELLPLGKALKLGAKKTTTTLAATFKLVPKGTTSLEDINYSPSKEIFRLPKKPSPLTFVEKRGKRLKKGTGEISEIQYFKKKASKKKSNRRTKWI